MNITTRPNSAHSNPAQAVRRVIIVHGYAATPQDHWFPWLHSVLLNEGIDATVVTMPTPEKPQAPDWEATLKAALGTPDAGTWVVAHSLGAITALRVLESLPQPWRLGGLILISGFTGPLDSLPVLDDYLAHDIDAKRVASTINARYMIRSDADPYVPPIASDELAARLDAIVQVQSAAGHFLAEDGVTVLPEVFELLRR